MGEPVGPEYTPGELCTTCWGPGKPFGEGPTPKYVAITFSGLTGIWAACNHKWIGQQNEAMPCVWYFEDETFTGYWEFHPYGTYTEIEAKWDPDIWIGFHGDVCSADFIN